MQSSPAFPTSSPPTIPSLPFHSTTQALFLFLEQQASSKLRDLTPAVSSAWKAFLCSHSWLPPHCLGLTSKVPSWDKPSFQSVSVIIPHFILSIAFVIAQTYLLYLFVFIFFSPLLEWKLPLFRHTNLFHNTEKSSWHIVGVQWVFVDWLTSLVGLFVHLRLSCWKIGGKYSFIKLQVLRASRITVFSLKQHKRFLPGWDSSSLPLAHLSNEEGFAKGFH